MKRRRDEEEAYFLGLDESAGQTLSYARELRAIGQALEGKNFLSLDLELDGGDYVARGKVRLARSGGPSIIDLLRDAIRSLVNGESAGPMTARDLVLRFTAAKIYQMDSAGREKRRDSNQTPDAHSLSQLLRGAGAYLDKHRNASLIGITVNDRWVTLRYRTAEGRLEQAKQDIEFFYNYWVKMYLQRSNRIQMTSQGPKVILTWDKISSR